MPHAKSSSDAFTWKGRHGKGAMKVRREVKRAEAEERQAQPMTMGTGGRRVRVGRLVEAAK